MEKLNTENNGAEYIIAKVKERLKAEEIEYTAISWGAGPEMYTLTVKTADGERRIRFGSISFTEYGQPSTDGLIRGLITLLISKLKYIS